MSKIASAFKNGKAFLAFLTCGDPDLETTAAAVRAAVENGADLIELGIPFSDPTAEGPVIQGANLRALRAGTTTDRVFDLVRGLRRDVSVPLVFMTYANVVFSYGPERFLSTCAEVGVDGLILPDLPFEEKEEFHPLCRQYGVDLISLVGADLRGPHRDDRPGGRGLPLYRLLPRRDGGCAARSPPTSARLSPSRGRTPPSPARSALASPHRSRPDRWPASPTA